MNATAAAEPQTITPERQLAAHQIGGLFNSVHQYLNTLEHKDAEGRSLTTKQLEFAHQRVEEASLWAIKHVLTFGTPPAPAANEEPPAPAETLPHPFENTPAGIDAVPPTTPSESA